LTTKTIGCYSDFLLGLVAKRGKRGEQTEKIASMQARTQKLRRRGEKK
jgi:hypothetical protein